MFQGPSECPPHAAWQLRHRAVAGHGWRSRCRGEHGAAQRVGEAGRPQERDRAVPGLEKKK